MFIWKKTTALCFHATLLNMRPGPFLTGLSLAIALNPVKGQSHGMSNNISESESTRSVTGQPFATASSQPTCQDYQPTDYFLTLPPCSGTYPSSASAGSDGPGGLSSTTTAGVSKSQGSSSSLTVSPTTSTRTLQASASTSSNAAGGTGSSVATESTSGAVVSQVCSFACILYAPVFLYAHVLLAT